MKKFISMLAIVTCLSACTSKPATVSLPDESDSVQVEMVMEDCLDSIPCDTLVVDSL